MILQVSLYSDSATDSTNEDSLASDEPLQAGMQFIAYFPGEVSSEILHNDVLNALAHHLKISSEVSVEYASHCSTVFYITILLGPANTKVGHIVDALRNSKPTPAVVVRPNTYSVFEVKKYGKAILPLNVLKAKLASIRLYECALTCTLFGTSESF